jgi:predicted Zn-dependent peptidase
MKKSVLPAILLIFTALFALVTSAQAQAPAQPYQEKLLNGLKVLVWNTPSSDKVTLKLRIHAGAAFDPKDKMGTMALLADIMFPDEQTFNYFKEDLEGELKVTENYDYIEITATGKAEEFVNILDTIRVGVVATPITPENFIKVRDAQLAKVKAEIANPAAVADRAVVKRLLSDFPYGRPAAGTPESLARIDRFDLSMAKDRLIDADNATLAVYGKIDPRFAVKAAKQMLGNWSKSEQVVPSTFAQPQDPDTKIQLIDQPGAETAEVRFAVRGLAMNDSDMPALIVWAGAFQQKLNASLPSECGNNVRVMSDMHLLPGVVGFGAAFPTAVTGKCFSAMKETIAKADSDKLKPEDLQHFAATFVSNIEPLRSQMDFVTMLWLDTDTYRFAKLTDPFKQVAAVIPADSDKVATRIFWKSPVVSVIVGDAARIKPQFDGSAQFALNADQEAQIKKEVADVIEAWRKTLEARVSDESIKFYADKLDGYYGDAGKTRDTVRAEHAKTFAKFETMKIELSKISVKPETETSATAIFDKRWQYRGKEMTSTGAAQQAMRLVKTDGKWLIVAEKDLLIYQMSNQPVAAPVTPVTTPSPAAKPQ